MKKPSKKSQIKKVDDLWSLLVKAKAKNRCEVCGKQSPLNSHHIFSRSNKSVRWNDNNGVCLCVGHHVFGNFSAHKAPADFIEWIKEVRGEEWYKELRKKANTPGFPNLITVREYLEIELKKYE